MLTRDHVNLALLAIVDVLPEGLPIGETYLCLAFQSIPGIETLAEASRLVSVLERLEVLARRPGSGIVRGAKWTEVCEAVRKVKAEAGLS